MGLALSSQDMFWEANIDSMGLVLCFGDFHERFFPVLAAGSNC